MSELKKIEEAMYVVPKTGKMRVPGLIIATDKLLQEEQLEKSLTQVMNVASLEGIVGYSIAMPDIHWGYGFPIGGVAAMDMEKGVISPGGVGYDINCGVRMAIYNQPYQSIASKAESLIQAVFDIVPSGVGKGRRESQPLTIADYKSLTEKGSRWSIEKGMGLPEDLDHTESYGCIANASMEAVSKDAIIRGRNQLGTIGSGNHFVEVGEIEQCIDTDICRIWGLEQGHVYIFIHSGSRGYGHQICQDTLQQFIAKGFAENLPDKQLVCAPIQSKEGQIYLQSMGAAANFAFNNRQQILHFTRQAFQNVLGVKPEEIKLLYDVCHNIAKIEEHPVDGHLRKLCVHRKGATRAFGPNHKELAPIFKATGQPVLVPGDMGRASYILAGLGNEKSWSSCCHGAGRAKSRVQSAKSWQGKNLSQVMKGQGVIVAASSFRTVAEEMPDAYKNVDEVVEAARMARLAKPVAKLKPHLVLKG
jgi:tRNA-splicing ligase RtcB (3'-phosphate/5'-hydroxy nucleic acid ligase)